MSFRAQRYDPSWRSRPPCVRGGDPPESLQGVDEHRLEMARKIEAIASAVAEKEQHDRNREVQACYISQEDGVQDHQQVKKTQI